jgi:hypothetical protein
MSELITTTTAAVPAAASVQPPQVPEQALNSVIPTSPATASVSSVPAPQTSGATPAQSPPANAASPAASTQVPPQRSAPPHMPPELDQYLRSSSFKEPAHQLRQQSYWIALMEDHMPRTAMEKFWLRDISELQVKTDLFRRALTTLLALHREASAREILAPNYHHFAPGGPGYRPDTDAYGGFMASGGDTAERMQDAELLRAAEQELANHGVGAMGVTEVAVGLLLPKIEALEKLIASLEARRDRLYEDFLRSVERRQRRSPPPAIDAEVIAP